MTPPDTNLETQARRHRGPLAGIAVVLVFALAVIFYWLASEVDDAPDTTQTAPASEPPPATPGEGAATGQGATAPTAP